MLIDLIIAVFFVFDMCFFIFMVALVSRIVSGFGTLHFRAWFLPRGLRGLCLFVRRCLRRCLHVPVRVLGANLVSSEAAFTW